jgi:peptide/nickel transport system permease protein
VFFQESSRTLWIDAPYSEPQLYDRMSLALIVAAVIALIVAGVVWRRRRKRLPTWTVAIVVIACWAALIVAMGVGPFAVDLLFDSGLVIGAFVVLAFGEFLLIMQAGMVSTLHDDYVLTARAKGLRSKTIRDRHAARNASLAVVARLAVSIPYLLTGLVIIETAVGFSGVGDFLFTAIDSQDVPLAVSTLAVIGFITMMVRLVLDILIAVLDPRIVVGRRQA